MAKKEPPKPFAREYEQLRTQLLDLSRRNPMLNYKHRTGSRRQIRFVNTTLQSALVELLDHQKPLLIAPLPEPEDIPPEEQTPEFKFALNQTKSSDIEYLTRLEALDNVARQEEAELAKLERWLRDRVREQLGLPPRVDLHDVSVADHARRSGINPSYELESGLNGGRLKLLQTLFFDDDLDARLGRLAADTKLSEQETGLSTLFLAFGFLRWFESSASTNPNFAPLLLLPVELKRSIENRKVIYRLQAAGDPPETNLSLREFLIRNPPDVPRSIPEFDPEVDDIDKYFSKINDAIEGIPNWRVDRYMTLGHFAFGRLAMYEDLEPENWKNHPLDNGILGTLMRGSEGGAVDFERLMFAPDYDVDDTTIEDDAPILISSADASQHSAIVDVMQNRNVVIEGPPGTGKSQTITNIIANALFVGKSVLFLADKQAALEVVQTRLATAGLGDFCLELHSHKAKSKAMIDNLRERCQLQSLPVPNQAWKSSLSSLRNVRGHITDYTRSLNKITDDGEFNSFQLFWAAIAKRRGVAAEFEIARKLDLSTILDLNRASLDEARDLLDIYASTVSDFENKFGSYSNSAWHAAGLNLTLEMDPFAIGDTIESYYNLNKEIAGAVQTGSEDLNIAIPTKLNDLKRWIETVNILPKIPEGSLLPYVASFSSNEIRDYGQLANERMLIERDVDRSLLRFNVSTLTEAAQAAEAAGYAQSTPIAVVDRLSNARAAADEINEVLSIFVPLISAFPSITKPTIGTAAAIAELTNFTNNIPDDIEPYLSFEATENVAVISAGYERLEYLLSTETDLRTVFSYSAPAWPALGDLEIALAFYQASFIGRAFSIFTGKRRKAIQIASALNREHAEKSICAELKSLLKHLRLRQSFLSNTQLKSAVGQYWNGLQTPLAELMATLGLRSLYDEKILPLDRANAILKPHVFGSKKMVAAIRGYTPWGRKLSTALTKWQTPLTDIPLDEASNYFSDQLRDLQTFVGRLKAMGTETLSITFEDIAVQARKRIELSGVEQNLTASPLHRSIPAEFLEGGSQCKKIFDVAELVKSLARAAPPANLRERLIQHNGFEFQEVLSSVAESLITIVNSHIKQSEQLSNYFKSGFDIQKDSISQIAARLDTLLPSLSSLTAWSQVYHIRQRVNLVGLDRLLVSFEKAHIAPRQLVSTFDALVAHRRAMRARNTNASLASGTGIELEQKRQQFREIDKTLQKQQQTALKAKLIERQPLPGSDTGPRKNWTEMHCLRSEFTKQRHASIRDIMRRAGRSIQALKPCFMMSPLSLAKFLTPDALKFDVLIVDEASQMRPEDSIGGLLRTKQVVVVGDPKQLPPTDFFSRISTIDQSFSDDEDGDDDINAESILDWCLRTYSSPRRLKWHYRSQCESLIAFSNRHFYDDNLITFPTARPKSFSIDLVRSTGNYKKSRNPIEASRVVEAVIDFMIKYSTLPPERIPTLGVVAMNSEQRELILEEFNRVANNPEVEQYLAACGVATEGRGPEEFFVKNLENVQGDERDVIMISLTYGKEAGQEHVAQRFGPINRSQGHRRLNVLFTRARKQIVLFSSMSSNDIVVGPNTKRGVQVLHDYLKYAESRRLEGGRITGRDFDSDFEREVCQRLRESGFEVDTQIGVSGYRIDLGIRHPENPSIYLAGVECDGATYHSAKSSRDRDKIRESILNGLGWKILRIWSTDWFADADGQTREIVRKLQALVRADQPSENRRIYVPTLDARPEPVAENSFHEKPNGLTPQQSEGMKLAASDQKINGRGANDSAGLTVAGARLALKKFRDDIIFKEFPGSEPERSILRDLMIEKFLEARLDEPEEFKSKIPLWMRERTDPRQLKYLEDVCAIVEKIN